MKRTLLACAALAAAAITAVSLPAVSQTGPALPLVSTSDVAPHGLFQMEPACA